LMAKAYRVDFLVMGAGVAGLRAAIELARYGEVLVVTKESLSESNTHYAQGGIAVAMEGDDDVSLHLEDTVSAGDGIVYRPAAQALVAEGPVRVAELIEWGAAFDREGGDGTGELLRTREGAHSLARILHANGDATGAEISRSLVAFARVHKRIRFAEWTMVTNLVVANGRVIAADLASADSLVTDSGPHRIGVRAVLVAAGGAGQVYSDTTNPAVATGDGIALAAQAGAELADMEFYQFRVLARRDSCSLRPCAAKELICATTAVSVSWFAIILCWNWLPAMWWRAPLPGKALAQCPAKSAWFISTCAMSAISTSTSVFPASARFWLSAR
jgi:L-aspartate oxidase